MLPDSPGRIAARKGHWQATLRHIQASSLKYCPEFSEVAQRWNDWWSFKADRPLLIAQAAKNSEIRWDKGFDLFDRPDEWVRMRRTQVEQTHYVGEALPFVRVDIGPVAMAAFLGAPLHFAPNEQTSWQDPVIKSWDSTTRIKLRATNKWLRKVLLLTERLAEDARGEYLVCLPDMSGAIDVLANMRTSEKLCLDLYEQRQDVTRAAAQAVDAWESVFVRMYDLLLGVGTGVTQWVSCWADSPFTVPTCDFNALIGPADFNEVCMPSLKEQGRRAGLCVLHLDGPDAARHAQTLAKDPDITAVQYTPGAGTPSALAKVPMFRMLQEHKVPLFVEAPYEEVKKLAEQLDPRGLAIRVWGLESPEQADAIVDWRQKRYA